MLALEGSAWAERPVRTWSIVIGSNLSHTTRALELRYGFSDGARMYRLLRSLPGRAVFFGAPGSAPARGDEAERAEAREISYEGIRAELRKMSAEILGAQASGWETHFIFYYSGHGDVQQSQGQAGTLNRSYIPLGERSIDASSLLALVDTSRAEIKHVILDACQAAAMARSGTARGAAPLEEGFVPPGIAARPDIGVIAAATSEQEAIELERLGGGILTHILHSALTGAADVDDDRRVSYEELYRFALAAGFNRGRGPLGLRYIVEPPHARFESVLADLRRAGDHLPGDYGSLRVSPHQAGRYRVYVGEQLYAQWYSEEHRSVELVVPLGPEIELHRCLVCEDANDPRIVKTQVPRGAFAVTRSVELRGPHWEAFGRRRADPWRHFQTPFGPKIREALPLPAAKQRQMRLASARPQPRPVAVLASFALDDSDAQLRAWGNTLDAVLDDRFRRSLESEWWELRALRAPPKAEHTDDDRVPRGCPDSASVTEIAHAAGIDPHTVVRGRIDRIDANRVWWTLCAVDAIRMRPRARTGGFALARKGALVDAIAAASEEILAELPHVRPVPIAVPGPAPMPEVETYVIDHSESWDGPAPLTWTGIGALALGAAATSVGAWSWSEHGSARLSLIRDPESTRKQDRFERTHQVAVGMFTAGGVLVLGGIGLLTQRLLFSEPESRTRIVVIPEGRGARLSAGWSF